MGFFWDLLQQDAIDSQKEKASTLEARVERLEHELAKTHQLLRTVIQRLEQHVGADLDKDGRVG